MEARSTQVVVTSNGELADGDAGAGVEFDGVAIPDGPEGGVDVGAAASSGRGTGRGRIDRSGTARDWWCAPAPAAAGCTCGTTSWVSSPPVHCP
jgi:hypothetical protein